jgi:DNA-3-methyladenine glycosylase II
MAVKASIPKRDRAAALRHFKNVDPRFYAATKAHHASLPETLPARRGRAALFRALCSTVVSQQLGRAAAKSIFARVDALCGGRITPEVLLARSVAELRTAGLSASKAKTLHAIADAARNDGLPLETYGRISEAAVSEKLQSIWGLGPWSVDMFMLFSLGRSDVFSPGDLGLMRGIEYIYGEPKGLSKEKALQYAALWSPYRSYASLLLWLTRDAAPISGAAKPGKVAKKTKSGVKKR